MKSQMSVDGGKEWSSHLGFEDEDV